MSRGAVGDGQFHYGRMDLREGFGQKGLLQVDNNWLKIWVKCHAGACNTNDIQDGGAT